MYPKLQSKLMRRGVTLVELMAVVAIVAILAVIAVVGYQKYLRNAKSATTKDIVLHITAGQESYFAETEGYLNCSTSYTDFFPAKPTDRKRLFHDSGHPDWPCWRVFRVDTDAAVYGGFVTRAGLPSEAFPQPPTKQKVNSPVDPGVPWYIVYAEVDQDAKGDREMMYAHRKQREVHIENQGN